MCKKLSKLLSMTLVLALVIQMLPTSACAATNESKSATTSNAVSEVVTEEVEIVEEVIDKRSEFSKEYKLSNGLHMSTVYADPVHYEEDGQWKDIDNTLKSSGLGVGAVLTNTAGVWDVSFPQQLSANKAVSITKDGYTLSFFMSGELRTSGDLAVASINASAAEQFSVQSSRTASAQIQTIDLSEKKAQARFPETVSDKLHSRVKYENVYSGTDIVYDLTSNQVKESIVMESYNSARRGYRYTLNTGSMIPVLSDSGEINLYNETKTTVVMTMPAPFLLDNAGEYNDDVTVTLTGSNGTYTLTYLLPQDWLSDSQRQWPVILDPMVSANIDRTNIWDIGVYEQNGEMYDLNSGVFDVGRWPTYGVMRAYIQYRVLPELSSADVIVAAELELYKVTQNGIYNTTEVHKVLETWPEVIDWNTQPDFDETVEDFVVSIDPGYYYWDVTDIARGWYEGENTGLMLKLPATQETETNYTAVRQQYYSSDFGLLYKPTVTLYFRNNNGLESYWDYTASSAGRAGTGYINDYTGNLVWIRGDIGFGGNRMPVSINHIYNANDNQNNMFGMGYGWRTNFNQRVYQWTTNTNYYVWEDSDGTDHYFYYDSTVGKYVDEDGLELTLTTTGSGTEKFCITDKYGNKSFFDTYGRLTKQQNNQATPSSIAITYTTTSGYLISTITDGAGRVYTFTYSSNLLNRISYKGTGSTELSYLTFGYSGSRLTTITDKDGEVSTYGYGTNNLLTSVQDVDGYKLAYTYTTTTAGKPSRVATVTESDGSVTGGKLTIAYAHNQTTFTDIKGNVQIKQFNNWGNTLSIQDGQGRAQYAQYANNGEVGSESAEKGNQLTVSSKLQNTVGNILNDSSFENGTTWTNISSAVSHSIASGTAYRGSKALVMTRSAAGSDSGVYTSVSVPANSSYTFSAYVKTGSGATAYLALTDGTTTETSETLAASSGWTRLQVTFTNDTSTAKTVTAQLLTTTAGTVYMDCAQIELAPTASRYNLVENGDFRYATSWTINSNCTTADARTSVAAASKAPATQLDTNVYTIAGSYTTAKSIYQTVQVSGSAGDTFVFAGWGKGDSVAPSGRDTNKPLFAIRATFNNADGTTTPFTAAFNPDAGNVWQYTAGVMVAEKAYSSIKIELVYEYNANTVLFDGIQLYKEQFGSSYTYDDNGNVTSVKDLQGQTTTYAYTSNNLTKEILPTGATLTYTYDNYHNVKTATTATGVVYNFAYDTYGNNTSVSILNGSTAMTSTAAYTTDGNRLSTTTDAAGKVTTYDYDANTNVLKSVQYPKDTSTTKTTYSYDSMYRLASAAATSDYGSALMASYTYTDDLLTEIETGSTTYSFSYGDFARRSSIQIGSRTLATYTYENTTGRLTQLDYGNGDVIKYTYDKQGNVTKQTYEDGDTVTYEYDNDGQLASVTDSDSGIIARYYYDFTDRLVKYTEEAAGYTFSLAHTYDSSNRLTFSTEICNGHARTISYSYDADNRVTRSQKGWTKRTNAYDTYNRVNQQITSYYDNVILTDSYAYRTVNGNPTTQLASHTAIADNYTATYSYTYDANGNITSVSDGTYTTNYVYDTANQLVRENNQATNKTWTWEYDDAGNILNRKEYAYTAGTLGTATDTVTYTYGHGNWGDLLTAYDGKTITYDALGNPLSDSTWAYTWEHGRELAQMMTAPAITITQQPEDFTGALGDSANISVSATGDDLTYAWYFCNAGGNEFSKTDTFTGPEYSVVLSEARIGRRVYCVITDAYGNSVTTNTAEIRLSPLLITSQPVDFTGVLGDTVNFHVEASGSGLIYEWFFRDVGSNAFSKTDTFTGPEYSVVLTQARAGRQVYCKITDQYGNSITTNTVEIRLGAFTITQQPEDFTGALGDSAHISVAATGSGLTYEWYYCNAGSTTFTKTDTFTGPEYSVLLTEARIGRRVYCVITDANGNSVTTNTAEIHLETPSITQQPEDFIGMLGETANISIAATGSGLTYEWYYCNAGSTTFTKTDTFTGPEYSVALTEARAGRRVYCVITDAIGNTVTTNIVEIRLVGTIWSFTYDANGMRTGRSNGTTDYSYIYSGDQLVYMNADGYLWYFSYDAAGVPIGFAGSYGTFFYVTNQQGDVVAILDEDGSAVVEYTYDAWGNILSVTGSQADTLGKYNPLRYRGYVYDHETRLYYIQSRYYNPETGRFLNADGYVSTGQGLLGNNMFTYCGNNPVNMADYSGSFAQPLRLAIATGRLLYDGLKLLITKAGSAYLSNKGYVLAQAMFNHGIWGKGSNPSAEIENLYITRLKESNIMEKTISSMMQGVTENTVNMDSGSIEFTATNETNADLFYSVQHIQFHLEGEKTNGVWDLTITTYADTYNFDEIRSLSGFSFANAANDLGWFMQRVGMMVPYDLAVSYTIRWCAT